MTQLIERPVDLGSDCGIDAEVKCEYGLAACVGDCEPCEVIPTLRPCLECGAKDKPLVNFVYCVDCHEKKYGTPNVGAEAEWRFDKQWHFNYETRCIYTSDGEFVIQAKVGSPEWWERLLGEHNALVMARRI